MKFKDIVCLACLRDPRLEVDLSNEFEVSQSTVRRWANGVAKPHLRFQKLVTNSIRRRQLQAARVALLKKFKDESWIQGIGIGEVAGVSVLRVNISSHTHVAKVPTLYEGIPVVTVVVEEIALL
jgi:hypothetical protein